MPTCGKNIDLSNFVRVNRYGKYTNLTLTPLPENAIIITMLTPKVLRYNICVVEAEGPR